MAQEFGADLAEIARGLGRRRLLQGAAVLGLAPATLACAAGARAASIPEVVLCNWGGDAIPAFNKAFVEPYEKKTGGKLTLDGSGPTNGKIRAMVEASSVRWDLCDSGVTGLAELATRGLLAPIDYSIVDKAKVLPGFAYEIRKDSQAMIELALLADGVTIDTLYPLDVDRAFRKFATIKDSLLLWDTGAQSQSLLRDGEVSMGWLWNTRANLLKREPGSKIDWTFKDGLLQPGLWVTPKGNPAGKQAMVAIADMQEPAGQVTLLTLLSNGPANPQAAAAVPADLAPVDPSSPANAAVQAKISADWYHDHHGATYRRFLDFLSA
jgi:putative spermidine/putrescine transport system substrate-binding protein